MIFISFVLSFLIVAFGQPARSIVASVFASSIGYAIFWYALMNVKKRTQRFYLSFVFFALVQALQLSWMTATEYQGIYILFVYAGLIVWLGLQFGFLSLLFPQGKQLRVPRILAIASFWTLLEYSRLYFLCGFSWNPVGLSLSATDVSLQFASIWGVWGLSFWVMLTNLFALKFFLEKKMKSAAGFASVFLMPYLFGIGHLSYHQFKIDRNPPSPLHMALLQTGLRPEQKWPRFESVEEYVSPYEQWRRICSFLKEKEKLDFIVLPEAALPFKTHRPVYDYTAVKSIVRQELGATLSMERNGEEVSNAFWSQLLADHFSSELVIGLEDREDGKSYSSAFHFTPKGVSGNRYDKQILLPLAEYLPFEFLRPLVAKYGIGGFFTHGVESKVFYGKKPFGISICYEESFPRISRRARLNGAELLVNITNDMWYPDSLLPFQHLHHGRLRAIENGIPLVRACNNGVTASIDSFGRIVSKFQGEKGEIEWIRGALFVDVDPYFFKTLYLFWGDICLLGLNFLFLSVFFLCKKRRRW